MKLQNIGVIGAGTMGNGIAQTCAINGYDVVMQDISDDVAQRGLGSIQKSLGRLLGKEKISQGDHDQALARIQTSTDISAMSGCDLVVEAASENMDIKMEIFSRLNEICPEHTILASNTSSLSLTRIAAGSGRPDRVVGMHFFNPATVQPLVELVTSEVTSDETVAKVENFARDILGKHPITTIDRAGFVVNRLLVPYLLQAMQMFDRGQASKEDIDAGMKFGCAHPQGPLELSDLIGLDTLLLVAEVLYEEFKEPTYSPPPVLRRMVTAGHLGRKSGRGFYDYG